MRTPRIVILAAFFFTTITLTFILVRSSPSELNYTRRVHEPSGGIVRTFFSFHTPLTIFPPNAIISLTDDNTTSFLARPADFGPTLLAKGLSGQLWIGSGFGDDSLRQGSIAAGAEGELGCSDILSWTEGNKNVGSMRLGQKLSGSAKVSEIGDKAKSQRRGGGVMVPAVDRDTLSGNSGADRKKAADISVDDGTDDYLHLSLADSALSNPPKSGPDDTSASQTNHADIQSIQEGAEIAGKVVLLSRGGCGFLEKVKWVQRRGGIALIVGDNTRGGPLIRMYAKEDTSNVTIPAVFTSHTTAHLLSSLIPPGTYIEDTIDENGKVGVKVHQSKSRKGHKKSSKLASIPTDSGGKLIATPRPVSKPVPAKIAGAFTDKAPPAETREPGWLSYLFSKPKPNAVPEKATTSNSKLDWVLLSEWDDTDDTAKKTSPKTTNSKSQQKNPNGQLESSDDFVIGVQDWRDPDLVEKPASAKGSKGESLAKMGKKEPRPSAASGKKKSGENSPEDSKGRKGLKGGSITPGSGEYEGGLPIVKGDFKDVKAGAAGEKETEKDTSGLLSKLFGDDEDESYVTGDLITAEESVYVDQLDDEDDEGTDPEHEGLWVTLTPTNGASPFLDTLLVLVVSPLVTLTVVYALLLLRSRIRRRRWRAPKSVVERLPVRTYQTVTSSNQSRLPSPTSSSPNTPLLQHTAARSRPRSRTTSGIPEPGLLLRTNSDSSQSSRTPSRGHGPVHEHEKVGPVASEWKKYMGKQVECVVCLEEYVDGVSRVMSLPCGHEFHVDCITPWLTTRRRTCPICKGDVVRSLARGSQSSPRYDVYHEDSDDEVQVGSSETINDHRTAALAIPRESGTPVDSDLERGAASPTPSRTHRNYRIGSWRSVIARSLGSTSRSPQSVPEDRSR